MNRYFSLIMGLLFLTLIAQPLASAELNVDYLEGSLEYRQGRDTWIEVGIGDEIPEGATVRLSGRGYAEISAGTGTVTLTSDGLYETSEMFGDEAEKVSLRQVIGSKFSSLLGRNKTGKSSVAAVRASDEAGSDDDMFWADETLSYVDDGLELMEIGAYADALKKFEEGILMETGEVRRECYFRKGLCLEAMGDLREARETLTGIRPQPQDPYLGEYTVVVGALYLESQDYGAVDDVVSFYLDSHPEGDAAQAAWLMSAYSLLGQGRESEAASSARNARDLDPSSDIGRAARELM